MILFILNLLFYSLFCYYLFNESKDIYKVSSFLSSYIFIIYLFESIMSDNQRLIFICLRFIPMMTFKILDFWYPAGCMVLYEEINNIEE